ncbi:PQQ-dependent sugar dehydrogenase [Azospirillum rugosum]|uniref:Glucose/arabinose dehydrogenase n=1 Tax=Azospirillum rugosum TaxID=416170 RepID=A0ABS4STZ9_9PROT|nr:PQQ-dependent sugar dehydrogenase [Azospirillum rugosum]MBP2296026.1 glucose/arabinose dehydrogenase [Azospirillum rugosum]MDQ0529616.1 glucose/arabinose dehydrogenase [Azospirillum rugosum]
MTVKHRIPTLLCATAMTVALATGASAQSTNQPNNLNKLQDFKTTGAPLRIQTVEQGGARAAAIRENLKQVKLPPGFKIDLYAIVPDARHMAVGTNVGVVFVGTRKADVWAVTDRAKARVADEVKRFAPSIDFKVPNGVCFSKDGFLFIAEHNRVLVFPAAEFFYESPDVAVGVVAETLIPREEESFNHGARVCRIGPDDKLYVALGQPYNVPPPEKAKLYNEQGIGGIVRMDRDGKNREVYARGVRNSVGMDFNPANGELWFTDNQVDGMGDDQPPGELNRATKMGQNFGFPWYGGGMVRTVEYKASEPPKDAVPPMVEMAPHAADLGMTFYSGAMFPAKYKGGIFNAEHGSWNRTKPVGARIMFTEVKPDGSNGKTEVFAEGWLNDKTGEYLGRPVDVVQYLDGSMLVSDDLAGAVYRISYTGQ